MPEAGDASVDLSLRPLNVRRGGDASGQRRLGRALRLQPALRLCGYPFTGWAESCSHLVVSRHMSRVS